MGGHGALTIALSSPGEYGSVSAFAPIVAPSEVPWGQKAFTGYLGADREAFPIAARIATTREHPGPSIFWDRSMRGTLADPGFPALARQLGLFGYWTTTRTKPDVCNEESPPPFCKMI
jgi:hypothetical protein